MDQIKIGKFIAQRRKQCNLTQLQLAEQLGITDRAVSKWETGKSLPDSSIMLDLCETLKITVNDLLSGEVVSMEKRKEEMENRLLELVKDKEQADKQLLRLETVITVLVSVIMLALIMVASFVSMPDWARIVLIVIGIIPFTVGIVFALRIEQTAGYYHCEKCGNRYVPTWKNVIWSVHIGTTRYMRCPKCGEKSWQNKVTTKFEM